MSDLPRAGATVRARPAPHLDIRRARFDENVLRTLWFVPLCCAIAAAVLSRVSLAIDKATDLQEVVELVLPGDPTALATAAATVSAAMLTFLGVVFSTTLVAIQLAASQYSPRIVRVFVRSPLTQITLGIFLATFVFSLNALVGTRETGKVFVPSLTMAVMYLLVLATVGTFIAFIHGMVRLLRVQYLLRWTARASHDALDHAFPPADAYVAAPRPAVAAAPRPVRPRTHDLSRHRGNPRVLQAVDVAGLAQAAAARDCWVELRIAVGEHASPATTVALVHGADPAALTDDDVHAHLMFGSERTLLQDPGFGLRQLVDTSSRALSPAINDPTTGVQALLRVEDLLARIADHPDPTGWYVDAAGVVRVRLVEADFERLATLGLIEILRYGADAPQITRALLAVCRDLATIATPERAAFLDQFAERVRATAEAELPDTFATLAVEPDRMGFG
jgi:uncharacterized membrane protein